MKYNFITISMGSACNLNCIYCVQNQCEKKHGNTINDKIFDFLKRKASDNCLIFFYGGEPLLYWENIKYCMEKLEKIKKQEKTNWKFGTITNGVLLTQEIIDYVNQHNMTLRVSYDGYYSEQTRGFDVWKEKKDLILQANDLLLNGVLTEYSYPYEVMKAYQEIDTEYNKIHGKNISFKITHVMCEDENIKKLQYSDFNKLKKDIIKMLDEYVYSSEENRISFCHYAFLNNYIFSMYNTEFNEEYKNYSFCASECLTKGSFELTLDVEGNIYACANSTDCCLGNIDSDEDEIMTNLINYVMNNEGNLGYTRDYCNKCKYKLSCQGGCLIRSYNERRSSCEYKKTILKTIEEYLIECEALK